jgi:hypothetical protein
MAQKINLTDGQLRGSVNALVSDLARFGQIPNWVHGYLQKGEVDVSRVTNDPLALQQRMWRFVDKRGAVLKDRFDPSDIDSGRFDEIFFSAYDDALRAKTGDGIDPLTALRGGAGADAALGEWDFRVESFDTIEEQGVLPDSIRAAGAIDYVYEFGERLRIFDLAEALVLDWASGSVDVAEGPAAARLYRYWKLLDDRSSPDERGMLYRRVLNKGGTSALKGVLANTGFAPVWNKLMVEIADFIDKAEKLKGGRSEESPVSPRPIYHAMKELQYNLSEHCTGMASMQVRELYAQLMEAFDVLRDPDVIASFGGVRRRNMWTVIAELSRRTFGAAPPTGPIIRLAVEGNRIFQLAAEFDEATFTPDDLNTLIEMGESYIINSSLVGEAVGGLTPEEQDEFAAFEEEFDDF